ncbi:hypothetical protein DACRYDRAFT_109477 [Dacryopinax primogenitus]|uniref:CMP/dCMP-type deaminase domain-containing protein n=1 Tax=Dacryopinax primogenitus (strain DJM 731) TaxID=1858805 RepID=M5G8G1_DACPD|nr:uncharacterized protein DACRYDRAFT_109477 [Dacryopinax primogenitus]EJU00053.1 hypothetical protein DACRYDRAFT_109477 [Dacryopinax primogenitus]
MAYQLGAIIVKGGKVLSKGHNHRRTHYDGSTGNETHQTAMSMHAEMHAIYAATGFTPAFKHQRTALTATQESCFELGTAATNAADGGEGEWEGPQPRQDQPQAARLRQLPQSSLSSRLSNESRVRVSVSPPPTTRRYTTRTTARARAISPAEAAAAARTRDIHAAIAGASEQGLKDVKGGFKREKRA